MGLIDHRDGAAWLEHPEDFLRRHAPVKPVPALSSGDGFKSRIRERQSLCRRADAVRALGKSQEIQAGLAFNHARSRSNQVSTQQAGSGADIEDLLARQTDAKGAEFFKQARCEGRPMRGVIRSGPRKIGRSARWKIGRVHRAGTLGRSLAIPR